MNRETAEAYILGSVGLAKGVLEVLVKPPIHSLATYLVGRSFDIQDLERHIEETASQMFGGQE